MKNVARVVKMAQTLCSAYLINSEPGIKYGKAPT